MLRFVLAFTFIAVEVSAAQAIEVGDVVRLSSMGIGRTVTAVKRTDRETLVVTVRAMEANAAEYCKRAEELSEDSPEGKKCIQEAQTSPEQITVNCRTATILLEGSGGGAYRPKKGGPWVSVADPDPVIQGDRFFAMACRARR